MKIAVEKTNQKPGYLNIFNVFLIGLLLSACARSLPVATELPQPQVGVTRTASPASPVATQGSTQVVSTPTQSLALELTEAPAPTALPTETSTPELYTGLTISSLVSRQYGGGAVEVESVLAVNSYFTRTLIAYPSDGLTIYGFMDVPARGEPPYPVVIASHGYIDPAIYDTIDYTTRYADALARNGFLVLHPNLRGYPPSDEGDNLFRVGMAIDVLNLIAIVRQTGGQPGALEKADTGSIGVWGHSMGGGVSTRVITVDQGVKAAVLYGAMSGDERQNFERIYNYFSNGERGIEELGYPKDAFELISPINYLDRIQAVVAIHHGGNDVEVPLAWSQDLCMRLNGLEKQVECYTYPGMPHTFYGDADELFMQRMVEFFNRTLR